MIRIFAHSDDFLGERIFAHSDAEAPIFVQLVQQDLPQKLIFNGANQGLFKLDISPIGPISYGKVPFSV